MGIPPETVMKCTGHKSYNTMKPYIETATETAALEMEKWNKNQYRISYVKNNTLQAIKTVLLLAVSIFFCNFATDKILFLSCII